MQILKCPAINDVAFLSATVVPRQVERGCLSAYEDQLAVMGERECSSAPGVAADLLRDGNGIPGQLEFLLVETLRHQISAANKNQISVRIFTAVIRTHQGRVLLRIECAQMNTSPCSGRCVAHELEKKKMPSVRQKCGPALRRGYRSSRGRGDFLLLTRCRGRGSTRRRNPKQGRSWIRRVQNRPLNSPCSTASVGSVSQCL